MQDIFGILYHFDVFDISIPKTTSEDDQSFLESKISDLYTGLSGPDSLVIIVYGGHGNKGGTWASGFVLHSAPVILYGQH